jgi:hypothetical protein
MFIRARRTKRRLDVKTSNRDLGFRGLVVASTENHLIAYYAIIFCNHLSNFLQKIIAKDAYIHRMGHRVF